MGRTQQIAGRELVLPPGTHHTEVHFDSISLPSPQNVRFQYRMDGIDPVWLDSNSSLTAVYTNIPTGSHFFTYAPVTTMAFGIRLESRIE